MKARQLTSVESIKKKIIYQGSIFRDCPMGTPPHCFLFKSLRCASPRQGAGGQSLGSWGGGGGWRGMFANFDQIAHVLGVDNCSKPDPKNRT